MLDPKKLEQACRDALAFIESLRGLTNKEYALLNDLREALGDHLQVSIDASADEARTHRALRYCEKESQIVDCSCGERFIVPRSADVPTWHDAQIIAGKKWLLHLEEMRIRGLLF